MDRPIIFSAPMIRALLDGRKTQTRRVLKPQPQDNGIYADIREAKRALRWASGDRLLVREAHYLTDDGHSEYAVYAVDASGVREHFAAIDCLPRDFPESVKAQHRKLRPSIHMPRWASRLTLVVESVKVERLQDISEADAVAEGAFKGKATGRIFGSMVSMRLGGAEWATARDWYADLWEALHGAEAWDANPWVAAITFRLVAANIDTLAKEAVRG
ncbi:MAG: hypothetical protein KGZ68_04445 [Dechloromonas sp.]|nr:hypothetical protein [Dechloromonas sp.]